MRIYILMGVLFLFSVIGYGQKAVIFSVELAKCEKADSLYLYKFDGMSLHKVGVCAPEDEIINYSFSVPFSKKPSFYHVGLNTSKVQPVILGNEKEVKLSSSCSNIRAASFNKESINREYAEVMSKIKYWQNQTGKLNRQIYQAKKQSQETEKLYEQIKQLDLDKKEYLGSLGNLMLRDIASLYAFQSFASSKGSYSNEREHFAAEYLGMADLSSETYNHVPHLYEAFKTYAQTMVAAFPKPQVIEEIDKTLIKVPNDSPAHQYALAGIMASTRAKHHSVYLHFVTMYLDLYGDANPAQKASLEKEISQIKRLAIGGEAPDFEMSTPEGDNMKLSDLRGKVVLIDFWASWCGPCRRENPNVLKAYHKYNDKGFEILGVSLDKSKGSWIKAIEKDGLIWHHVSDLRGWKNTVAKTYQVSSIPATVLIDREGKIVAKNLRGPVLDRTLQKVFEND